MSSERSTVAGLEKQIKVMQWAVGIFVTIAIIAMTSHSRQEFHSGMPEYVESRLIRVEEKVDSNAQTLAWIKGYLSEAKDTEVGD